MRPPPARGSSPLSRERVRLPGSLGHELAAIVDRPAGDVGAWCLFAHAFGSSKDLRGSSRIAQALARRGMGVLRFDFTGLGQSGGRFADTTFATNVEDLEAAAAWLRREHRAPGLLVGHSLGGAAVLAAADGIPECVAVATIAAPSHGKHLARRLRERAPGLAEEGEADVEIAGKTVRIGQALVDDLEGRDLTDAAAGLGRALLIFHSPVDDFVGVDHAARLFQAARHPKSFVSLDDADHLLLADERDARFVAGILCAWAGRYFVPSTSAT